jgi:three-Cys-motif partner protein
MANTVEHPFGGAWTESKLAIVNAYARAFQTALKHTRFENWYIDPFAGTGERIEKRLGGGLLEGKALEEELIRFAGSARLALEVEPPPSLSLRMDARGRRRRSSTFRSSRSATRRGRSSIC